MTDVIAVPEVEWQRLQAELSLAEADIEALQKANSLLHEILGEIRCDNIRLRLALTDIANHNNGNGPDVARAALAWKGTSREPADLLPRGGDGVRPGDAGDDRL